MWKPVSLAFFCTLLVMTLVQAQPTVEQAEKAQQAKNNTTAVVKAETLPPALPAGMFTGSVRQAYEVAAEIPEVLAELNCHCGCDKSQGHANLLHCFVDSHAAG